MELILKTQVRKDESLESRAGSIGLAVDRGRSICQIQSTGQSKAIEAILANQKCR